MKLVFIHGRDQQGKDADQLQRVWEEAFDCGLDKAGLPRPQNLIVHFPYYGDALDELVKQLDEPLLVDIKSKGVKPDTPEAGFRGQLLTEIATNAAIPDAEIAASAGVSVQEKGPLNWAWVHAILRTLDKESPFGDAVLDGFTRDVYVYLTYPAVSKRIDAIVAKTIPLGEPCVVVAHSLGTIVAYQVLSDLAQAVDVCGLVTVGSPLGLASIRDHLPVPLARPTGVKNWQNAFDKRDVVALLPLDGTTWSIQPPIENFSGVDNFTDNRHGISGYLDDATVARWMAKALI
ncbi:hypothetical protein BH160DRAFT_0259 [Burkholderia sp. H160]|nr:hypothetical protein BH160DRAFT_0259 [Burkholderia sp. H160]